MARPKDAFRKAASATDTIHRAWKPWSFTFRRFTGKAFSPRDALNRAKSSSNGFRRVLSEEAVDALPPTEKSFVSVIDGRNILMEPPARFVNHSCNPNARGSDRQDIAIRIIEAGEEVTVDYAAEHVPGLSLECNCQAPNCRGLIVVPE